LPVIAISVHAQALDHRQDGGELVALAAVGHGQHHVVRGDHAQVAVAGLGRVHEERRRAGGRQRGGDLAADVAALAHAHHDHAAAGRQHHLHGLGKASPWRPASALQRWASMSKVRAARRSALGVEGVVGRSSAASTRGMRAGDSMADRRLGAGSPGPHG
jgi:hypothetical protein